jgi:hypothetical protein
MAKFSGAGPKSFIHCSKLKIHQLTSFNHQNINTKTVP